MVSIAHIGYLWKRIIKSTNDREFAERIKKTIFKCNQNMFFELAYKAGSLEMERKDVYNRLIGGIRETNYWRCKIPH